MNGSICVMHSGPHLTRLAALLIAITGSLSSAGYGQSPPPLNGTTSTPGSVLPRKVVVPISTVTRFFPEVTRETSTGRNLTAVSDTKATRSVIYANSDSSKKVTITVDQYPTASPARYAAPSAVVSCTFGRCTAVPSKSA